MLDKAEVVKEMLNVYTNHSQNGKTTATGVHLLFTALDKADPADMVDVLDMFEARAKEVSYA
jgi:hypothetical protein